MEIAESYREWLRNCPKVPADRIAIALAAIDAFEASDCEMTTANLQPIVTAASSSYGLLYDIGFTLLMRLTTHHAEAQQCVLQMARDKHAAVRFHAAAYLHEKLPEELRREVVDLALRDRSGKVRRKGIERADGFRFTELLPRLDEMQRTETDAAVRRSLAFHIPLLRDGFFVEPSPDRERYTLTVRTPRALRGRSIRMEKYSEEFVREEVARMQKEP